MRKSLEDTAALPLRRLRRHLPLAGEDRSPLGQPRRNRLPVEEFVTPAQFDEYREYGESIGFRNVFSGPFVRSSYMADLVAEGAELP